MDPRIEKLVQYWATSEDFDPQTRLEISALVASGNETELTERFYSELEFGTAGLRGIVSAGTARMNVYNVRKAACAFARYIKEQAPDGWAVGMTYDSRLSSESFARAAAEVIAAHGIQVRLTNTLRPVPLLSYMVKENELLGGICITASHNPPDYNGVKIYWHGGCQVTPPHDKALIQIYNSIQNIQDIPRIQFDQARSNGLIKLIGEELVEEYLDKVKGLSMHPGPKKLKIVFTPLHGTTGEILPKALKRFGFEDVTVVPEQEKPDGNFPTVEFPNPEDPKALRIAVELAHEINADLVLATDPDGDRLGMFVKESGDYRFVLGNDIGSLLVDYVLTSMEKAGELPENPLVVKTIVTSPLQNRIAESFGVHVDECLTGFKWIAKIISEYETGIRSPKRRFICGGEESYGFMAGNFVRDKDGIMACSLAAEMVHYHFSHGRTLTQAMDGLYQKFGLYADEVVSTTLKGLEGKAKIDQIMTAFRNAPPRAICQIPVVGVEDYLDEKRTGLPKSNVLRLHLEDGSRVCLRPSGTEPKIKMYLTATIREAQGANLELMASFRAQAAKKLQQMKAELQQSFV